MPVRTGLLVVLAWLVACDDRYGTYVRVDGRGAIEFDRVELFFADRIGDQIPILPDSALTEPESGMLGRRLYVEADEQRLSPTSDTWTYYLPPVGQNQRLGDYVMAIAYRDDTPVGIGELFDFTVTTADEVRIYTLPLVDHAGEMVQRWGRTQEDCVLWRRPRDGHPPAVAVVRDDDSDCDDFLDNDDQLGDCVPLHYCDGAGGRGCHGTAPCFTDRTGTCQAGKCLNVDGATSSCTGASCAADAICSGCDLSAPPDELLACALLLAGTHEDHPIVVKPSNALCFDPQRVELSLPFPCQNPTVDASVNFMPAATFRYDISAVPNTNRCLLVIHPPTPDAEFVGVPHLLISVDHPVNAPLRSAFIVGLSFMLGVCDMTAGATVTPVIGACGP